MGRYFFKIQTTADDPNKVLMGQFLPIISGQRGQFPPELDPLDCGYKYTEDAWSRIRAFCPEEIDWDSVTFLEIMYDESPFPSRGKWILRIHTNHGNDGTIIMPPYSSIAITNATIIITITVTREDEDNFQRKVFEYLSQPDIIGLQETKKLHWVIKCGLGGSSNSDVNEGSTNSTAANNEFHLIWRKSSDPNDSDDDSITGER